jgi:hypothetical protein
MSSRRRRHLLCMVRCSVKAVGLLKAVRRSPIRSVQDVLEGHVKGSVPGRERSGEMAFLECYGCRQDPSGSFNSFSCILTDFFDTSETCS